MRDRAGQKSPSLALADFITVQTSLPQTSHRSSTRQRRRWLTLAAIMAQFLTATNTRSLLGRFSSMASEFARSFEQAIDAEGAHGNHISVELSWFSLNWKTRPFGLASRAKDTWRTQVIVQVVNTQSTGSSSLFLIVGVGLGAGNSGTGRCKRWHKSRAAS